MSTAARIRALKQFAASPAPEANAWSTVSGTLWKNRQPAALRIAALNLLLAMDPARLKTQTAALLPTVTSPDVRSGLLHVIQQNRWVIAIPAVIDTMRLHADQDPDGLIDSTLKAFTETTTQDALARIVCGQRLPGAAASLSAPRPWAQQASAWVALVHRVGIDDAVAIIDRPSADPAHPTDPNSLGPRLAAALGQGWHPHALPTTRPQLAWWAFMQNKQPRSGAAEMIPGAGLRHAPIFSRGRWPSPETVAHQWNQIQQSERMDRETSPVASSAPASLTQADRYAIALIRRALWSPPVRARLFAQAAADQNDRQSEAGGVVLFSDHAGFTAHALPAKRAAGDARYIPPPELLTHLPDALVQYHFHAQQQNNHALAGPGPADLRFADAFGCHCVVLTTVGPGRLNADWYTAGGLVVDLGTLTAKDGRTPPPRF